MENIIDMEEDIEVGVTEVSVCIPLRVELTSRNNAPFEFTSSVDEAGNIVLTPVSTDVQFEVAKLQSDCPEGELITDLEDFETTAEGTTTKSTTIILDASMLVDTNNTDVVTNIDEIGQCVISPLATKNMFVTVSINDSLNLTTPEEETPHVLEDMEEDKPVTKTDLEEVSAEVVEENTPSIFESLTDNFSEAEGTIMCDTADELSQCVDTLLEHYPSVNVTKDNNRYMISYHAKQTVAESYEDNSEVIDRFLRGELVIVQGEGNPEEHLKHIAELDADGYSYYYDDTNGCIVIYRNEI